MQSTTMLSAETPDDDYGFTEKHQSAIRLLREHMNKHGLQNWSARLMKSARVLGNCSPSKKIIRLSIHLIDSGTPEQILNTILHEIAHALCPGHGHDKTWVDMAKKLGCDGKRCSDIDLNLKYNFECGQGCYVSYNKKCRKVEHYMTGTIHCRKHNVLIYRVIFTDGNITKYAEKSSAKSLEQTVNEVEEQKEQEPIILTELPEPTRVYLKYNYACPEGCFCSYARKCKSVDILNAGGSCKKHKLLFTAVEAKQNVVAKPVIKQKKTNVKEEC
jgi:hypothetical protein